MTRADAAGDLPAAVAPRLVLDTNVVLDWLYFRDPRCAALADAMAERRAVWIATAAMRDEIERVLARGLRGRWAGSAASVTDDWARWATMVESVVPASPAAMRCTDGDDQKFIDLAVHANAAALLSADRAVLKLARRARALGLAISTVAAWQPPAAD